MLELYKTFFALLFLVVDFLAATIVWFVALLFNPILGLVILVTSVLLLPAVVWFAKENV